MKVNPWLLPGAALLVTSAWIISQKNSSAILQREITVLTERIELSKTAAADETAAREAAEKAGNKKGGNVDWKEIAGKLAQSRGGGGMGDMRTFMRLQRLLMEMSAEELCAQLDEIATLDIEDNAREMLKNMIVGALVEKDPKLVIERFGDSAMDERSAIGWQLGQALAKWADTEPGAAAAWLDRQIAAGKFESKSLDGKNEALLRFEGPLVLALMKTDLAAATARVEALPAEQREELFKNGYTFQIPAENEGSFVTLVRETMPADKVGGILAEKAGMLAMQGGYDRVDDFIARANATDDEKASIVREAMKQKISSPRGGGLDEASIDGARTWAASQASATVDSATGEILGDALWRSGDFDKISSLVLKYNEASGNDDVLASFLKSGAARNRSPEKSTALIEQIADPALREEISALPEYKNLFTEP